MAILQSTGKYKSGYLSTVTITPPSGSGGTATTYSQANVITLADCTFGTVTTPHLGGLDVEGDGPTSFGQITIEINEDGSAEMVSSLPYTIGVSIPSLSISGSATGLCTSDRRAVLRRGQPAIRQVTFTLQSAFFGGTGSGGLM